MSGMDRREAVRLLAMAPVALTLEWAPVDVDRAARLAQNVLEARRSRVGFEPKFFTPPEWETVRVLVDLVIPRDDRSGSATDAGVPEFMDFMMMDRPSMQMPMRGGLAWLDAESVRRFARTFAASAPAERTAILDDIAWPARARPEMSHGAAFFSSFRDLTSSGFWSSRIGIADLEYRGNTWVPQWTGCPPEALKKLGVSYGR